jgi:hypothetical protein
MRPVGKLSGGDSLCAWHTALALPTENRRASLMVRSIAGEIAFRTIVLAWRRDSALERSIRAVGGTTRRLRWAWPQQMNPRTFRYRIAIASSDTVNASRPVSCRAKVFSIPTAPNPGNTAFGSKAKTIPTSKT